MKPLLRSLLALLAGLVLGSVVNMALVVIGPLLIPPPPGVDVTDAESLAASAQLLGPRHFIFPFLAHALGTLVGALTTYLLAAAQRPRWAFATGALFLLGGIAAAFMIPAPLWFLVLDLAVAYLPMAALGIALGRRLRAPGAGVPA